jgi:hydroxyacylglutathione hydrolase
MERDRQCQDLRAQNKPTVPSSLEIERAINPFLRWDQPSIQKQLEAAGRLSSDDADATFAALRSWKDTF